MLEYSMLPSCQVQDTRVLAKTSFILGGRSITHVNLTKYDKKVSRLVCCTVCRIPMLVNRS